MKLLTRLGAVLLLAAFLLQPTMSSAVTLGQIDDFEDGTTQGWTIGIPADPAAPVNALGGPAGPADHYLLLTADGSFSGGGGKLAVFNQTQWIGDYLAAGVNLITMSVNNLGTTDLYLRLRVADESVRTPFNAAFSTKPVFLPAGSGWTLAIFSLAPANLTAQIGSVQTALASARELRIFHNPNPSFPPPPVVASLGLDNIRALRRDALPYLPLLLLAD